MALLRHHGSDFFSKKFTDKLLIAIRWILGTQNRHKTHLKSGLLLGRTPYFHVPPVPQEAPDMEQDLMEGGMHADDDAEMEEEEDIELDEAIENGIHEAHVQQEENFTILQFAIPDKGTLGMHITHKIKTGKVVISTVIPNSIAERHGIKMDDEVTVVRDSHGTAITTRGGEKLYAEFIEAAGGPRPFRFDVKRHSNPLP